VAEAIGTRGMIGGQAEDIEANEVRAQVIYANKINQAVSVKEQQVKDYERSMESIIFDRIRAVVCGSPGSTDASAGELGRLLRSLSKCFFLV